MTTPAANDQLGTATPPVTRLVTTVTGAVEPATPRDVEQRLAAGGFFWLDLESLDPRRLEQFGRSLRLDASATAGPEDTGQSSGPAIASTGLPQRPSVAAFGDSIRALVPTAGGPAPGEAGIPVRIVYTAGFLLTSHSGPCPALEQARHRYDALHQEGKADGPLVLFPRARRTRGQLRAAVPGAGCAAGRIQVELLTSVSSDAQAEVLAIRRRLADTVQSLSWYAGDLGEMNAGDVGQLAGIAPAPSPILTGTTIGSSG